MTKIKGYRLNIALLSRMWAELELLALVPADHYGVWQCDPNTFDFLRFNSQARNFDIPL